MKNPYGREGTRVGEKKKRLDGERKLSRCLPNTSTCVPNDRSQRLYCVLPIMLCQRQWRARGERRAVGGGTKGGMIRPGKGGGFEL